MMLLSRSVYAYAEQAQLHTNGTRYLDGYDTHREKEREMCMFYDYFMDGLQMDKLSAWLVSEWG